MSLINLIRGGGDLASGVALRLHRAGLKVMITELAQPLVVRRLVSFAEAVYRGDFRVENVTARRVNDLLSALRVIEEGEIPVLIDPDCESLRTLQMRKEGPRTYSRLGPVVLVDGRMMKTYQDRDLDSAALIIGLGPGFVAGRNCHAVIETKRGHTLGRVIWDGTPEANTGIPESVADHGAERVLRAPGDGIFKAYVEICDHLDNGQPVGEVDGLPVAAPFSGVLRGLLQSGMKVTRGMKIGDLDPRDRPEYCSMVSDKSLAVGGGVLEAILSRPELRLHLWDIAA
jgi:xanthine dehydrogenase accessory factor